MTTDELLAASLDEQREAVRMISGEMAGALERCFAQMVMPDLERVGYSKGDDTAKYLKFYKRLTLADLGNYGGHAEAFCHEIQTALNVLRWKPTSKDSHVLRVLAAPQVCGGASGDQPLGVADNGEPFVMLKAYLAVEVKPEPAVCATCGQLLPCTS